MRGPTTHAAATPRAFLGPQVARTAFLVAAFGWGIGCCGPFFVYAVT